MPIDIVMPNLGFDAQEGRLVAWLKQPGDTIQKGDVIAVIESDKANVDLESIASGVLLEHLVPEDSEILVGSVIARIGDVTAMPTPSAQPTPTASARPVPTVEASPIAKRMAAEHDIDLSTVKGTGRGNRITRDDIQSVVNQLAGSPAAHNGHSTILALPKVRKMARENGIDLTDVHASGPKGQITETDIARYLNQATSVTEPTAVEHQPTVQHGEVIDLSRMRQTIGKRLQRSKQDAPHFYVTGEFDLEYALQPHVRVNDLIQYLTVRTLMRVPQLNATYQDGQLVQFEHVNLAIAVALEQGLITPVIAKAERYSIEGLAAESRALIQRTRNNQLQTSDLQNATFTISNLGVIKEVDHFTAVINPPQVAILAVGTVKKRPVVIADGLHLHHTVNLTLSGDHRVVDGMDLGRFMAVFQEELDRIQ